MPNQSIKISFLGNCGSNHYLYNLLNYQKWKFHSKMNFKVVILAIKISFFGNFI